MSGFAVTVVDDLTEELTQLLRAGKDLTPAMQAITGLLEDLTEEAFARQAQPGGPRWKPLARSTIESRVNRWSRQPGGTLKGGRISNAVADRAASQRLLQDTGRLAASVHGASGADFAQLGVAAVYAAIHQLGGQTRAHTIRPRHAKALRIGDVVVKSAQHPGSNIPARPYLPIVGAGTALTQPARDGIFDILERHFGATG